MATLEPRLWSTLPEELLHFVFARLPVFAIAQLRTLSKVWKKNIDSKDSEFTRAFDAVKPFARICLERICRKIGISCQIYDLQQNNWHGHQIESNLLVLPKTFDGGLICYVHRMSGGNNETPIIIVINPLTRKKKQLSPLLNMDAKGSKIQFMMVELIVEKTINEYKLYVVGCMETIGGDLFAQVYDSHLQEWSIVESREGRLFGMQFSFDPFTATRPCVYNFANQKLQTFKTSEIELPWGHLCYALIYDHVFVWHKEMLQRGSIHLTQECVNTPQKYYISEYHFPEKATDWVKLEVHECDQRMYSFPEKRFGSIMQAGSGFLLVDTLKDFHFSLDEIWLYNLSARTWRQLPSLKKSSIYSNPRLCKLNWSALP